MTSPKFVGFHDPSDVADYIIRFDDMLEAGETISLVSATIDPGSAGLGMILGSASYAPIAIEKRVQFWLSCSSPDNAAYDNGVHCTVTVTVNTSSSPARTFQRSATVLVKQSSVPAPQTAAPTELQTMQRRLSEARDARHALATGARVSDVWREGRRVRYTPAKLGELDSYIAELESAIAAVTGEASQNWRLTRRPLTPRFG